jgi:hypothetical protein
LYNCQSLKKGAPPFPFFYCLINYKPIKNFFFSWIAHPGKRNFSRYKMDCFVQFGWRKAAIFRAAAFLSAYSFPARRFSLPNKKIFSAPGCLLPRRVPLSLLRVRPYPTLARNPLRKGASVVLQPFFCFALDK